MEWKSESQLVRTLLTIDFQRFWSLFRVNTESSKSLEWLVPRDNTVIEGLLTSFLEFLQAILISLEAAFVWTVDIGINHPQMGF